MHCWISEMYYTLFDGFPEVMNADWPPPSFTLDQADGKFLHAPHLVSECDSMNLSLHLIYDAVCISDTLWGGFSPSIGKTDLTLHTLVGSHAYYPIRLFFWGSLHLSKFLANVHPGPAALLPTSFNSCHSWWRNNLSKILLSAAVTGWNLHPNRSIALCRAESEHMVAACRAPFRHTWNCPHCDVVTFSGPYSWTSNAAQISWIIWTRNWGDCLLNSGSTLALADCDIFYTQKSPFIL